MLHFYESRTIPSAPDYVITIAGDVYSCRTGRWLRGHVGPGGYRRVSLTIGGKSTYRKVHQLVLETFVGPRPPGMVARHLNGDSLDNRLENLAYGTYTENNRDRVRHGNDYQANRTECPRRHPYSPENTYIDPKGSRCCRECKRASCRAWRAKRKEVTTA